jgi:hypothetical protein
MKVAVFFYQPDERRSGTLVHELYGRYHLGGLMFIQETRVQAFMTRQGEVYASHEWEGHVQGVMQDGSTDFLMLCVDEEEGRQLLATCEACAAVKKPFNLKDLLLLYLPFYEPEDLAFDEAPTLHNAQAVILILRVCLRRDNRLLEGLEGLNSRQTMLQDLYNGILPFTVSITWGGILALVKRAVPERSPDKLPLH